MGGCYREEYKWRVKFTDRVECDQIYMGGCYREEYKWRVKFTDRVECDQTSWKRGCVT